MTCIVGVRSGDSVWIGADSFCRAGDRKQSHSGKLIQSDGLLIGVSGRVRDLNAVRIAFKDFRDDGNHDDPESQMVQWFVPTLVSKLRELGALRTENGIDEWESAAVVGFAGRLWSIDSTLAVGEHVDFASIGTGCEAALGALHMAVGLQSFASDPSELVQLALKASSEAIVDVAPPFRVLQLLRL